MDMQLLIVFILTFVVGLIFAVYLRKLPLRKHVCIVILGDVGRSPRMQFHARSFLNEGFKVDIVGYSGSAPLKELQDNENVNFYYLKETADFKKKFSTVVAYGLKVLYQSYYLFKILMTNPRPSYLMVQNPPAIPTLPICWLYCYMKQIKFIIDWHNYAYSVLGLSLGQHHLLVKIALFVETYFGTKAHRNFCVTQAFKEDLDERWSVKASVLYDRPPNEFHSINLDEKHDFLMKLSEKYVAFRGSEEGSSAFTKKLNGKVLLQEKRPGLLVSSTSWTEDEDFSILIDALNEYEGACNDGSTQLPDLVCVITGKGHLKEFYLAIIQNKNWKHITVVTPWLETEDYPKLLASADLGVCLHKSSSGLDLPMKVVDMFGCGLPVLAYDFKCLHELVKNKENSFTFTNNIQLAEQLKTWFEDFPNNAEQIRVHNQFKTELKKFQEVRWHDNWKLEVLPYFHGAM